MFAGGRGRGRERGRVWAVPQRCTRTTADKAAICKNHVMPVCANAGVCAGGAHVGNNLAGALAVDVAGDEHFYCTASCIAGASDEKLQDA